MFPCLVNIRSQIDARLNFFVKKIWHNYYDTQLCDSPDTIEKLFAFNRMEGQIHFIYGISKLPIQQQEILNVHHLLFAIFDSTAIFKTGNIYLQIT